MTHVTTIKAQPGDLVVIEGHRVGDRRRLGEILEVLGDDLHQHYRVRWEDGHESVFYPSNDATIQPRKK
jgi:hypothetical protein